MGSLLYTLSLGSFLMVLPYLSEGLTVSMSMPSQYSAIGSELRVTCKFEATNQMLLMALMHGGTQTIASYSVDARKFVLTDSNRISLEVGDQTGVKGGSLTFIMPRLSCSDFTWYVCRGTGDLTNDHTTTDSTNETLQVLPTINPIQMVSYESNLAVHQVFTFRCSGVISREGPFSIQWYQKTNTPANQISAGEARETNSNQCSRSISSTVSHNVTEDNRPNLILWCKIVAGQTVWQNISFDIQETTTIIVIGNQQPSTAGPDAGAIVGIVLGITATIVLVVLLVWFLVIRPKRQKADGPTKDQGPEPNAKDYQEDRKGKVNPALDEKHDDDDNSPYTVSHETKYHGGHENPAMDQDMSNHMGGSTV